MKHIWEVFRSRILEPIFNEAEPIGYEQLVKRDQRFAPLRPMPEFQQLMAQLKPH